MQFGEYFKTLRKNKKYTQKDIAQAIGKCPMYVSGVESGKNGSFNEADLETIANFMCLSEEERNDLVRAACLSRNKLPEEMTEYFLKEDNAFTLATTLWKEGYTPEKLRRLLNYMNIMGDTTKNAL